MTVVTGAGLAMIDSSRPEKLTYRDYLLLPEDGSQHELIGGEHFVTPSPTLKHQLASGNLYRALSTFVRERKLGLLLYAPFDVVLSFEDVVEPDLLFVSQERLGVLGDKGAHGAPDLAVEILSPSTRRKDEVLKRALYERSGVSEYWIVDPRRQEMRIYRSTLRGLRLAESLSAIAGVAGVAGDRLESPLFPGFSLPVAEIFE